MHDLYQLTQCVYAYHNNIKITGIVTCWVVPHQNLPICHIRPVKRSSDELFPCICFVVVIKCNNIFWNRRYFNVTTIYHWPINNILYPEYKILRIFMPFGYPCSMFARWPCTLLYNVQRKLCSLFLCHYILHMVWY